MRRIQSTRELTVSRLSLDHGWSQKVLKLDVHCQAMKALLRASQRLDNLSTLVCVPSALYLDLPRNSKCSSIGVKGTLPAC